MVPIPLESTFVVRIDNATLLSESLPVFTFEHPDMNDDEFRRYKVFNYRHIIEFIHIHIHRKFNSLSKWKVLFMDSLVTSPPM